MGNGMKRDRSIADGGTFSNMKMPTDSDIEKMRHDFFMRDLARHIEASLKRDAGCYSTRHKCPIIVMDK
jgi:hypothetical protein